MKGEAKKQEAGVEEEEVTGEGEEGWEGMEGRHGERGWEGGGEGRKISHQRSFLKVGAYGSQGLVVGWTQGSWCPKSSVGSRSRASADLGAKPPSPETRDTAYRTTYTVCSWRMDFPSSIAHCLG